MARFSQESFLLVFAIMIFICFVKWKLKLVLLVVLFGMWTWMFYPMYQELRPESPLAQNVDQSTVFVIGLDPKKSEPVTVPTTPKLPKVTRIYYRKHNPHSNTYSRDEFIDRPDGCSDQIWETTHEDGRVSYAIIPPNFCLSN